MHQDPETNSAQQLASLPQFQFLLAVGMIEWSGTTSSGSGIQTGPRNEATSLQTASRIKYVQQFTTYVALILNQSTTRHVE